MSNYQFPEWVNTLVNGAIAGSLLWGVVEMGNLQERVSVMEANVLGSIKLVEQTQRTTDVIQDTKMTALESRMGTLELELRGPVARLETLPPARIPEDTVSDLRFRNALVTF